METPKIRIMVVEDDEAASLLISEVLNMEGYEAIVVNQSSKAIEVAETKLPQAFLLDLMMPPPDGFKLCRMLREHPNFRHTPIMIVTALNDTDSKIVAIGAGANDYLVKPFRIDELISKVKELLGEEPTSP
jgi:DNA-binding response OmpR family regulator